LYEVFLVKKYQKPLDERESSGYVRCWNGMDMFLPYYPKETDSPMNTEEVKSQVHLLQAIVDLFSDF
jgi:hypothetical protein